MDSSTIIKAYSYLRFSTPEQMQGDSFRRQAALAVAYSLQNGLELDTTLTFQDAGVSAYRGRNAGQHGQLGAFLEAIREGIVPQGSYLLVESLDRLSRQTARKALRLLESVIEAGAVVVTLSDGRKYDSESIDSDPVSLLISILTFMRAHEESAIKAMRIKAVWTEKRIQAAERKTPMTRCCPAWLDLDRESGLYLVIPERVEVVQRIFDMTLNGIGQEMIAQTLNREGQKPFRNGKFWHRTYIAKILSNPAVLGTFIPHVQDHSNGKRTRHALDPIAGYFPAIITAEQMGRVQAMSAGSGQPRRGRHASSTLNNIFGGLGRCSSCGSTMTVTNKGDGNKYFICTRAKAGAGCTYRTIPYQQIEACFLSVWEEILDTRPDSLEEEGRVRQSLQAILEQLEWLDTTIASIVQAIETSSPAPSSLIERLGELELDRKNTLKLQQEYSLRQKALERNILSLRIDALRSSLLEQPIDKAKANAHLRQLFSAIYISRESESIELQWQHSRYRTPVYFKMVGKKRVRKPELPRVMPVPAALPSVPIVPEFITR